MTDGTLSLVSCRQQPRSSEGLSLWSMGCPSQSPVYFLSSLNINYHEVGEKKKRIPCTVGSVLLGRDVCQSHNSSWNNWLTVLLQMGFKTASHFYSSFVWHLIQILTVLEQFRAGEVIFFFFFSFKH